MIRFSRAASGAVLCALIISSFMPLEAAPRGIAYVDGLLIRK